MGQTAVRTRGDSVVPKHVQVREYVRSLLQGAAPGTATPSERELVQAFGVARMTVRQALDALVGEGLLERIPGKGTFVADGRSTLTPALLGFTEEMRRRGVEPASRTLLLRPEAAGPGIARALEVEVGAMVLHWQRLRLADATPVCLQDLYLPSELAPDLLDRAPGLLPDSWYADLERRGHAPSWAEDSIDAGLASEAEAIRLSVAPAEAVLRIARRTLCDRMPVEVSRSTYRSDRFTVWVPMSRPGAAPTRM